ncbi:hypothetical protein [Thermomonas sp.]|uniref:tetratricopeptide repeat protein n=1 Tax=Thermomonas sp. TaxID=1971895 RepID=UPI002618BE2F|nr:hypothetical protein [Thermomonas sp.]
MKPALRWAVVLAVLAFAILAGSRVVGLLQAERLARSDPQRALRWHPGDPDALWAMAEQRLASGDHAGAASAARTLLAKEPLQGRAFRLLAGIDAEAGHERRAHALYAIAAHRAPRDPLAIAGLVQGDLQHEDYAAALRWIDFYLRTSPDRAAASGRVLPRLVPLALDGRFADAMVAALRGNPPWRAQMMGLLWGNSTAAERVYGQLDREGALRQDEFAGWIDGLIRAGDWDLAHTRWAAHAPGAAQARAGLYNGDFSRDPSGIGFDWRLAPGMASDFQSVPRTTRRALGLRFFDQPVRGPLLQQRLHLAPGEYVLQLRMRARGLRGDGAPVWQVLCAGKAGTIAAGDPLDGGFDWIGRELRFQVPKEGCPGQTLQLTSLVQSRNGQRMAGEIWIDDVRIEPGPPTASAPDGTVPIPSPAGQLQPASLDSASRRTLK